MPFDPCFSSKCSWDEMRYSKEGIELYHKLKGMPLWERKREMWRWKKRGMSEAERDAWRLIGRELNTKYSVKNRFTAERSDRKRSVAAKKAKAVVLRS